MYFWLWLILTASSTLTKLLQGNTSWGLMLITWWLPSVVLRTTCTGYSRKWSSSNLLQWTCENSELYYNFKVLYWQRLHVQCITVIFLCAHFIHYKNFHFLILHFPRFTLTLNDTLRNIKPRFHCISSKSGVAKRAHVGAHCTHGATRIRIYQYFLIKN